MQNSDDFRDQLPAPLIDAIGGEPLAGSGGFEAEEPELAFSVSESEGEA
jgi:hypothetical protein